MYPSGHRFTMEITNVTSDSCMDSEYVSTENQNKTYII